jgi:hypothetical protein
MLVNMLDVINSLICPCPFQRRSWTAIVLPMNSADHYSFGCKMTATPETP